MAVAISPSPAPHHFYTASNDDLAVLDMLIANSFPASPPQLQSRKEIKKKTPLPRRDAPLDPLLLAATAASGPHVTRHHYHHGFQPGEEQWSWTQPDQEEDVRKPQGYVSKQAPRRQRLATLKEDGKENNDRVMPLGQDTKNLPARRLRSNTSPASPSPSISLPAPTPNVVSLPPPPLEVKCMARTRIPTPHGEAFLHLFHNNRDAKEHLAIVVDPVQLSSSAPPQGHPAIRSKTLDALWHEKETSDERLLRGAYVGRLSQNSRVASPAPGAGPSTSKSQVQSIYEPPLIRIHSECFTGETIGSQRCDCGEQLDESLRCIFHPSSLSSSPSPPRGAVIYLRQEGRNIGLLSKLRAYNLQDMGHDTVSANLMLGYAADERGYDIAAAILHDLGMGEVRLMTNNPDKVRAMEECGLRVVERVGMVPRAWQCVTDETLERKEKELRSAGATMIGASTTESPELEKYLRTKVARMGHMLWLPEVEGRI